ncbi:hypothetical protein EON67_03465 [archaeon]|nr:MAG: hypothetical protein EON67_03465 [archaeon]
MQEPKSVAAVKNWLHREGVRDVTWTPNSGTWTVRTAAREPTRAHSTPPGRLSSCPRAPWLQTT